MKQITLLSAAAAALVCAALPANALTMVAGDPLAHDCYVMAKAGVDLVNALRTCNSALENQPLSPHDRAGTYDNRGAVELAMGRIQAAMDDDNTAIILKPDLADAFVDRAGAYVYTRQYDEAIADANHGIALGPTIPFVGYYNRAIAEQMKGNYMDAYQDYQKVLVLEPKFTPAAEQIKNFILTKKVDAPTLANAPKAPDANAPIPTSQPKAPEANAPVLADNKSDTQTTKQ